MPQLKIHGKEHVIAEIFSGGEFAFVIPDYQRPYAWTTEQAGELLSDLLAMMGDDEDAAVDTLPPYFLGSVVLIKDEGDPKAVVVDGQQRITTLTILVAALRDVGDDDGLTEFLYQKKQRHVLGSEDRYRLTLRDEDREFFKEFVQDRDGFKKLIGHNVGGLDDPKKNMIENGKLFHAELSKLSAKRRDQLVGFLLNQCVLIVVTSLDRDSAYRIFSILNDRGLDLSHTDILKAEIIGDLSKDKVSAYAKKWVALENSLGREPFEDLFAHVRMIYRRTKMRESILKEFREHVCKRHSPQELVDDVLVPYGEAFADVLTEGFESTQNAEDVNRLFSWLNRIDNVDWVPPAVRFLKENRNDPPKLVEFLTALERLAASMFIRRVDITKRIERYGKLMTILAEGKDPLAADSALQLSDDEKKTTRDALSGDIYHLPRVPLYILLRLDDALSDNAATYNYKTISIEHVLPQTPKADSKWVENFSDEDERSAMTHILGNLVLLSRRKNTSASNYEFDVKKEKYFKQKGVSPFPLTTDVLNEAEWTPDVVRSRQKRLVETLSTVWGLD